MSLQDEIDIARAEIRSDGYPMSIGEWISLYEQGEIDIHPEFQRFYRWSNFQKSRLIESILLGIPIPPIFVAQRDDGVWDVVDGLQRLSTIYEFVGILKDDRGALLPPLKLERTSYLPSLQNKMWDEQSGNNTFDPFTSTQRLLVKRAKIDVSIILRESDERSKFELFQRLNTGGSPLSEQEVRNSILVMMNPEIYRWIRTLSQNEDFKECVSLTDRAISEQYDMDLVLRFLIFRTISDQRLRGMGDLNQFMNDIMIEIVEENAFNLEEETEAFNQTFAILSRTLGVDSFHRFDSRKRRFMGGFLVSAYELVALGIGYNFRTVLAKEGEIRNIVEGLWVNEQFVSNSGTGVRASSRIPVTVPLGRQAFLP